MKKMIALMLALLTLVPYAAGCDSDRGANETSAQTTAETTAPTNKQLLANTTAEIEALSSSLTSNEAIAEMRRLVWDEYAYNIKVTQPKRSSEIKKGKTTKITLDGTTMKVMTKVTGKAPEDGYPLFLVYHGGGYDPSGTMNESQWSGMADRYAGVVPGIFCSIRSVSDNESSGQIFSTDISWKFYDRIIEDAILYMNADPNKVYIVGYSAGGNGVYQIAPRITDRLASATMTAGHPENIDLTNLYNLPFFLNVGELDSAYSRNTVTVEYDQKLDDLAERYGGGYEHYTYVHTGKEHGVVGDNAENKQSVIKDIDAWLAAQKSGTAYSGGSVSETTHAAVRMTEYTRDPLPNRLIWNASTTAKSNAQREVSSFYWLSSEDATGGVIDASFDKETNTITIHSCSIRRTEITIYLNEKMVDLFSPVTVIMPNGSKKTFTPEISLELLRQTTAERGDPNYQFCASYTFKF